jgi:hypothetical protein
LCIWQVVSKSANIYPKDPEFPTEGVEDMTRLAYLHEPGVLQNLQIRYSINEIYVRSHYYFVFSALHTYNYCDKDLTFGDGLLHEDIHRKHIDSSEPFSKVTSFVCT